MATDVTATTELQGWDEQPYDEGDDLATLTRATVTKRFTGGVEGEGRCEYLMAYAQDGTATFVGLEHVRGQVDGREGTVVLQHTGTFDGGVARASLTVVPGSGTGALAGLAGHGDFAAEHGPNGHMALSLEH